MTTTFYAPPSCFHGDRVVLPPEEAQHAVRVLRARAGDEVQIVDGEGNWFVARLDHVSRTGASAIVASHEQRRGEPSYRLTLYVAPLKNAGRYETFLEKAVELGVSRIVPIITERTERVSLKMKRAESILIAAMKQCGRSRLTELNDLVSFDQAIAEPEGAARLLCHEAAPERASIARALEEVRGERSLAVFIGPEGGFTEGEVLAARSAGYAIVSIGERRLRAETAAITAAAAVLLSRMRE